MNPLELNAASEPFLRLPAPHQNIIITPPRITDKPALIQNLNDPGIWPFLRSVPYPYLEAHADYWLSMVIKETAEAYREFSAHGGEKLVDKCPVFILREVQADGSEVFIGNLSIQRSEFIETPDEEERSKRAEENAKLPAGDPRIVWSIGNYLSPSYHRRGIMSAAVGYLIHAWAVPKMGVQHIVLDAFTGNDASVGVFLKDGFNIKGIVNNCMVVRGEQRSVVVLEWRLK